MKETAESLAHAVVRSGLLNNPCRKAPLLKSATGGGAGLPTSPSKSTTSPRSLRPRTTSTLSGMDIENREGGGGRKVAEQQQQQQSLQQAMFAQPPCNSHGGDGHHSAASSYDDAASSLGSTPSAPIHGGSHLPSPPMPITFSSSHNSCYNNSNSLPRGGGIEIVGQRGGTTSLKIRLDVVEGADVDGLGYPQAHPGPPQGHPRENKHKQQHDGTNNRHDEMEEEASAFERNGGGFSPASPIGKSSHQALSQKRRTYVVFAVGLTMPLSLIYTTLSHRILE